MKTTTIKLYDNVRCRDGKYKGLGTVIEIDRTNKNRFSYLVEFRYCKCWFIGNKNLEKVV